MWLSKFFPACLLIHALHCAYFNGGTNWHSVINFWSTTICLMKDVKTMNFYGICKNSSEVYDFYQSLVSTVHSECSVVFLLREYGTANDPAWRNEADSLTQKESKAEMKAKEFLTKNPISKKILGESSMGNNSLNFTIGLIKSLNIIVTDENFSQEILRDDENINWSVDSHYIFLIIEEKTNNFDYSLSKTIKNLKTLWENRKIQNVLYSPSKIRQKKTEIYTYDPFVKLQDGQYGQVLMIQYETKEDLVKIFSILAYDFTENFNGYPLRIGLFLTRPSVLWEGENHHLYKYSKGYGGTDGHVLAMAAQFLNFDAQIHFPTTDNFGSQLDNGTYVGLIGDAVSNKIDMSFMSYFVKPYGTGGSVIDFSYYIGIDRVCILVPRALQIPKWAQIYLIFEPFVWLCLLLSANIIFFAWYYIQKFAIHRKKAVSIGKTFYETFVLITGGPVDVSPKSPSERVFLAATLLATLTLIGTFSGALYTSFTGVFYYRELNNLNDVDESGLPITYLSSNLMDIFGDEDESDISPLWTRLRKKLKNTYGGIEQAALYRNATALGRENYFPLTKYLYALKSGLHTLHLAQECPRTYTLAYVLPKNSFLRERMNSFLAHLNQAGIPDLRMRNILNELIFRKKLEMNQTRVQYVENRAAFKLVDVQTSFYTLVIGLACSFIVFLEEIKWLRYCYYPLKRIKFFNLKYKKFSYRRRGQHCCSRLLFRIKKTKCFL